MSDNAAITLYGLRSLPTDWCGVRKPYPVINSLPQSSRDALMAHTIAADGQLDRLRSELSKVTNIRGSGAKPQRTPAS